MLWGFWRAGVVKHRKNTAWTKVLRDALARFSRHLCGRGRDPSDRSRTTASLKVSKGLLLQRFDKRCPVVAAAQQGGGNCGVLPAAAQIRRQRQHVGLWCLQLGKRLQGKSYSDTPSRHKQDNSAYFRQILKSQAHTGDSILVNLVPRCSAGRKCFKLI